MLAVNVPDREWFMIVSTKKWLKKTKNGKEKVEASVIGDNKLWLVEPNEEVELQKK